MKQEASRFLNGPGGKKTGGPKIHLYRRLNHSVNAVAVDSAADSEVVSSELMRAALTPGQKRPTPNLRCVVREKAHSSRGFGQLMKHCEIYLGSFGTWTRKHCEAPATFSRDTADFSRLLR